MNRWAWIITVLILASALIGGYFLWRNYKLMQINSFKDCVEAGFPVAESYPRQCHTSDGRSFTEKIVELPRPE